MSEEITTYLLHIEPRFKHARHYLGSTTTRTFERRMHDHTTGNGANFLKKAFEAGCTAYIARLWHSADRTQEATIKRNGHLPRYCPICVKKLRPELTTCRKLPSCTLPSITSTNAPAWTV